MRVLLVDDDAITRHGLVCELNLRGYEAVEACDGAEASLLLRREAFDLVITDIQMPGMDGLELLMMLRKERSQLPVIAMAGDVQPGPEFYMKVAEALGAHGAISKPIRIDALFRAIQDVCDDRKTTPTASV